jgi:hypothetical protein
VPDERSLRDTAGDTLSERAVLLKESVPPLPAIAFWLAIALPLLYIPFLVAGINRAVDLGLFLALLGVHVGALYAGRSYDPN